MRINESNPIEAVAFKMVKEAYPEHLQESYELHMTAAYSAPPYVYVLQELAGILSGVGIGVLSNMVYAKIQSSKRTSKDEMSKLLAEYASTVKELQQCVKEHKEELKSGNPRSRIREIEQECLDEINYHEKMSLKLSEQDPETIFAVEQALKELKKRSD